ncbi:hypothetical protein GCM10023185_23390 [Hymenobacter saemangeumensis]|uniref:DUF4369 domain-containing protein n=1 Tax=Hymenobacter saemangeumensis TaxID=1084522 RepID=A0ABP8IFZ3_9BACT
MWYGLGQYGLLELAIDHDSLRIRQVDVGQPTLSLAARYKHGARLPIAQVVALGERHLLIVRQGVDSLRYSGIVLFDYVPGHHFQLAWNAPDTLARSPQALARLQAQDRRVLFGDYYYSARFINELQRLRPIDEMTKPEFERYFARYADKVRQATRRFEANEPNYRYVFASQLPGYNFALATQALLEEGFCPLYDEYAVQALYRRFYSRKALDKKVKAILGN